MRRSSLSLCVVAWAALAGDAGAAAAPVRTAAELRDALAKLRPGGEIVIASGEYGGGFSLANHEASAAEPTVIRGEDPKRPPVFTGGSSGWHLSDCSFVTLRSIAVRGQSGNGVNVDDAGTFDTPSRGIVVEDVAVREVGPRGNCDALKMSGVREFAVRGCRFEGWGGSAIDMVGCAQGVVEDCVFRGREGYSQASGVQMKGGTRDVVVRRSLFEDAGERPVNLGGSTGLEYFREKAAFEAERITVAGNRFLGGTCAVAFVSSDGGRVLRNTIVRPRRWVLRILQEQRAEGFRPCRGGVFEENVVVWDAGLVTHVNVGDATEPRTFAFRGNAWFAEGGATSRPGLPVAEEDAVHGVDPRIALDGAPRVRVTSTAKEFRTRGADAYERR